MLLHLIAHALVLLFVAISFYFIGKSAGRIAGRRQIMEVITEVAEEDAKYLIKGKITRMFSCDEETKKKLTKQEQKTKDDEQQKRLQKSYEINGRLELFKAIAEIL